VAVEIDAIAVRGARRARPTEILLVWLLGTVPLFLLLPYVAYMLAPPTGDEPFYLVTAISIIEDGDIDERNNYAEQDYLQFAATCEEMDASRWGTGYYDDRTTNTPGVIVRGIRNDCPHHSVNGLAVKLVSQDIGGPLYPHAARGVIRDGLYSKHGVGLPILISPFYAIGGRFGVMAFLVTMSGLIGVNVWLLALAIAGSRRLSYLVWGLVQFSAPIVCHSFLVFPAIPAALLVIYAYRRIDSYGSSGTRAGVAETLRMLLTGIVLGLLPWLHDIYLTLVMPFVGWFGMLHFGSGERRRWSCAAALLLPFAMLSLLLLYHHHWLYGTVLPNFLDHDRFLPPAFIPVNLLGMVFDQKYGLLIYAPVFLIALVGCTRATDRTTAVLSPLLLVTPYVLAVASYEKWWGQWCPPARYLVPILPLLAAPLAREMAEHEGRHFRGWTTVLAAASLLISMLLLSHPHLMWNWETTDPAALFLWLGGVSGARLLPAIVTGRLPDVVDICVQWAWLSATLALVLSLRRRSSAPSPRGSSNP
jgi:hypothetical protein